MPRRLPRVRPEAEADCGSSIRVSDLHFQRPVISRGDSIMRCELCTMEESQANTARWVSYQAERKADERRAKGPPVPAVDPPAETGTGTQEAAAAVQEAGPAVSTQEAAVPSPLQNKRKSPDGMSERRRQKSARRSSTESPEPTGKEVPTHILQQLFGSGGMAHLPAGLSKVLSGVPIGMPGLQAGLGILGGAGDQELGPPGADPYGPWGFDRLNCEMFPALASRRNFWCIQRHQATGASPRDLR